MHNHRPKLSTLCQVTLALALLVVTSSACSEQWRDLFNQRGIAGEVTSVARLNNLLYFSGSFVAISDQIAHGMAKYDLETGKIDLIDVDVLPGLDDLAGFPGANEDIVFGLPSVHLRDTSLKVLRNNTISDVLLDGEATGLQSMVVDGSPVVVATGEFSGPSGSGALAVFDGEQWTYTAPLITRAFSPTLSHTEQGSQLLALGMPNSLLIWNGQQTSYFELAEPATSVASAHDVVYLCVGRTVKAWENGQIKTPRFGTRRCDRLNSRKVGNEELLVIENDLSDALLTDGSIQPYTDPDLPRGCPTGPHFRQGDMSIVIYGFGNNPSNPQLCIWQEDTWSVVEPPGQRGKDTLWPFRIEKTNNEIFLLGEYTEAASGQQTSIARWADSGFKAFEPGFEVPWLPAISKDFTTFASQFVDSKAIRVTTESSTQEYPTATSTTYSIEAGQGNNPLEFFFHDGRNQVYQLDDKGIRAVGQSLENPLWSSGLHVITGEGPAAGLYQIALVFDVYKSPHASRPRILRLVENAWIDITPEEFFYIQSGQSPYAINSYQFQGQQQLFASSGDYAGHYDGDQWTLLPPLTGAEFNGPVAPYERETATCFYATSYKGLARYCGNTWSWPPQLKFTSPSLQGSNAETLNLATFEGRPVLLVQGGFINVGSTVQSGFAVLDLETLFYDGME